MTSYQTRVECKEGTNSSNVHFQEINGYCRLHLLYCGLSHTESDVRHLWGRTDRSWLVRCHARNEKREHFRFQKTNFFFFSSVRTHFPNCCLPLHPNLFKKGDANFDDAFTRFEVVSTRLRIVKGSHSRVYFPPFTRLVSHLGLEFM